MSATEDRRNAATDSASAKTDMKLEVIALPVSDIDRAKEFYLRLGWRLDGDFKVGTDRGVQFTPPGSACSVHFGTKVTPSAPGSAQSLHLVVSDIQAARDELARRGVEISEVFHYSGGPARFGDKVSGPAPDHLSYASYASFRDPDGNGWLLQEVTARAPGRIGRDSTSFASPTDLASAFRRAAAAHDAHEKRTGQRDANWPEWYAAYMVAEQAGGELPS